MRRVLLMAGLLVLVAACLPLATPASAQSTTMELRNGEVLAVDGNVVTVRGPQGVKQFVVPENYQFDMNGKKLTVRDLKPGMKYTAMITTTETPIDVTTTEVRQAEVVYATAGVVVVRNLETNELRKFTVKDLRTNNVVVLMDGKEVEPSALKKGDKITATIVTKHPPEIITEQDLKVFVAQPPPPKPPRPAAAAPPPPPPPPAEPAKKLPKTGSSLPLVGLSGLVLLGLGAGVGILRRLV